MPTAQAGLKFTQLTVCQRTNACTRPCNATFPACSFCCWTNQSGADVDEHQRVGLRGWRQSITVTHTMRQLRLWIGNKPICEKQSFWFRGLRCCKLKDQNDGLIFGFFILQMEEQFYNCLTSHRTRPPDGVCTPRIVSFTMFRVKQHRHGDQSLEITERNLCLICCVRQTGQYIVWYHRQNKNNVIHKATALLQNWVHWTIESTLKPAEY